MGLKQKNVGRVVKAMKNAPRAYIAKIEKRYTEAKPIQPCLKTFSLPTLDASTPSCEKWHEWGMTIYI